MSENLNALRAKIRALLSRTTSRGCTEAEASAAAAKAAELMDRYGFALADLGEREPILTGSYKVTQQVGPIKFVVVAIAAFCDCKSWKWTANEFDGTRVQRLVAIKYFGRESDVQVAEYLTGLIEGAMKAAEREWSKARKAEFGHITTAARNGFRVGMAHRISARLVAMKTERNATVDDVSGKRAGELVLVKNAEVEGAYRALDLKLTKAKSRRINASTSAYTAGQGAGDRVSINPGVAGRGALRIASR